MTQFDPVTPHMLHRYDTIDAAALESIVEDIEPGTAAMRRRMIYLLPVCLLAVILGVVALYIVSDAAARRDLISTLLNPAIMGGGIIGGVLTPWIAAREHRFKLVRNAMLRHRRCPHCGYSLFGLAADPADGATVCPECGSAWRLDAPELRHGSPTIASQTAKRSSAMLIATMIGLLLFAALGGLMFLRF